MKTLKRLPVMFVGLGLATGAAWAHGIDRAPVGDVPAAFDLAHASVARDGDTLVFRIRVEGAAGSTTPEATGEFAGSEVHAYVWPTTLDTAAAGFDSGQGILALAVTFHPDFDDGAGGASNRDVWHSHWVVLVEDAECGPAALKVADIPEGATPTLPETWPGAPILIASPDLPPVFDGPQLEVHVPAAELGGAAELRYDGVAAGLRVNGNLHAPLLCVENVFAVASGDLSLPGTVE